MSPALQAWWPGLLVLGLLVGFNLRPLVEWGARRLPEWAVYAGHASVYLLLARLNEGSPWVHTTLRVLAAPHAVAAALCLRRGRR